MTDAECSRGLIEGKQNNVPRANNGALKPERYLEECEKLRTQLDRTKTYLYGLAAVVVVGAVIFISIVAGLYGKLSHDMAHHSHRPKVGEQVAKILENKEMCFSCGKIRLGPSPEEDTMLNTFVRKDNQKGEQCCVETPAQLLKLLELFIERTYREEMAKGNIKVHTGGNSGNGKEDKPAAHLMGVNRRPDLNQPPGSQFSISNWIYNQDLAFAKKVTYRHGRIVVPVPGLYYVYSQISFLELFMNRDSGNGASTESPSLSHYLYRYNIIYPNGGEEKMIQNSITKCWGQNKGFGEYTSYLGAVFDLRQGDEIFVKVSNLTMVVKDPKSNYFGLFKL
ncbi:tumor necrosis factor ligand superfamily member 10 [Patella vulgata]|uniref:tumor necrosis factor ligand superfamily member 10 n=1 Tax=Patella vulgata TaxID=6465 RepID=UPI00218094A6|nr:tumor necrosis factor ligand superfamily member 10 [Patella vulgata]